ncbi:hypothetical protein GS504_01885 [Rhodococcus hoagii]|nr:hypothetical protein [Prescottella equi]NKS72224.1 hypothetical protein [Prescottella equi]
MANGTTHVSELRSGDDAADGSAAPSLVDIPRYRGRAVKAAGAATAKRGKGFTLLRTPELEKAMKRWAFENEVDQSEMVRELVYILFDAESGELEELPDAAGLGEFLVQRIMERRIADAADDQ